jgi:hypothetical protein
MLGWKDLLWALGICVVLTGFFQWRPAYNARELIERDARDAFLEAYKGRREVDGDVITPPGKGAHIDASKSMVLRRTMQILADKISWTGNRAEIVARHSVELVAQPPEEDTVDVHITLEKRGNRWVYTLFEVRDGTIQTEFDGSNPWVAALVAAEAEQQETAEDGG